MNGDASRELGALAGPYDSCLLSHLYVTCFCLPGFFEPEIRPQVIGVWEGGLVSSAPIWVSRSAITPYIVVCAILEIAGIGSEVLRIYSNVILMFR